MFAFFFFGHVWCCDVQIGVVMLKTKQGIYLRLWCLAATKTNFQGSLIRKLLKHGGCFNWQAAIKALMIAPLVYPPFIVNLRSWEITPPKDSQRTWGPTVDGNKSCTTWDAPKGVDSEEKPVSLQNARRMHPQKFLKFCFPQESFCLYLEDDPPATLVRMVQDFTWQSETLCNERIGRVLASEKVLDETCWVVTNCSRTYLQ